MRCEVVGGKLRALFSLFDSLFIMLKPLSLFYGVFRWLVYQLALPGG